MTHDESSRRARDTLILLGTTLGGAGLVLAAGLLPAPMLGCLGLPIAMAAGLAFAIGVLICGRLEVGAVRHAAGLLLAVAGLYGFFHAYVGGLDVIVRHFLGRAGAPPLTDLVRPAIHLGLASAALGGSVALRRARDFWMARAVPVVATATVLLAWGFLIVLAILGLPLGA